jgi:hypothetical protein
MTETQRQRIEREARELQALVWPAVAPRRSPAQSLYPRLGNDAPRSQRREPQTAQGSISGRAFGRI